MERRGRRNRYTCGICGGSIITENTIDLVTPFMVGCRATPDCIGTMNSALYPPEAAELRPTHLWVPYTEVEIAGFRRVGDQEMVEWATGDHGKLVESHRRRGD